MKAAVESTERFERVCEILDRHGRNPARLIAILQAVQEEYRYLPAEVMAFVATAVGLPPARVYGVATFYAHFALAPKGKHVIRLCNGTACNVKDSIPILEAIRARLGLPEGTHTTDGGLFTVETVSCLGACGLAPVVVVDDAVHGQMTPAAAVALVDELAREEACS